MLARWDWEMIGALGQWAGAVMTLFAVLAALWLSGRDKRVRLAVRATVDLVRFAGPVPIAIVRLVAVNDGPRAVTLTHAGAAFASGGGPATIPPEHVEDFPKRLDQGDHMVMMIHVPVPEEAATSSRGASIILRASFTDATGRRYPTRRRLPVGVLRQNGRGSSFTSQP